MLRGEPFRAFGLRARGAWRHAFEINSRSRQNPAYRPACVPQVFPQSKPSALADRLRCLQTNFETSCRSPQNIPYIEIPHLFRSMTYKPCSKMPQVSVVEKSPKLFISGSIVKTHFNMNGFINPLYTQTSLVDFLEIKVVISITKS